MVAGRPTQGFWVPRGHALPSGDWQRGGEVSPARWSGSFTVSPRKHGRGEDAARSGEEGLTCCSFSLCFSPHRKERPDRAGGEERNQAETHEEGAVWSERLVS